MKRKGAPISRFPQTAKRRRTMTGRSLDQQVEAVVERQRMRKGDWKVALFETFVTGATGISDAGQIFDLQTNLIRGDTAINNFEGMKIEPHGLSVRYQVEVAAADADNMVRVIVFQYFDSTLPVPAAILNTIGGILAPLSAWQHTNRPLRKILSDRTYQLGTVTSGQPYIIQDKVYIKGKRLGPLQFNASTTAIQTGAFYILAISDSLATPHPAFDVSTEILFLDQ